jgi:hypothetical protein
MVAAPEKVLSTLATPSMAASPENVLALRTLIRTSLATAIEGKSWRSFRRECARLQVAGACVGEKFHYGDFASVCASECVGLLDEVVRFSLESVVPALGIQSDIELVMDAVTVLKPASSNYGKHKIFVVGGIFSATSGLSQPTLLGARGQGISSSGEASLLLLLKLLKGVGLDEKALKRRLSSCAGDGAECRGGAESIHPSTGVCERLCAKIGRGNCSRWDELHLMQKLGTHVLDAHGWSREILDVAKSVRDVLGSQQGSSIAAGVAEYLGQLRSEQFTVLGLIQPPTSVFLNPAAISGTRMITHLIHIPTRLLANLPWMFAALSLRAFHSQAGIGSKTIAHYRV